MARIITVSRQFGSGGRELGKRLSDLLGWDYYDREIIQMLSDQQGLDPEYVHRALSTHGWHQYQLTYRNSFHQATGSAWRHTEVLVKQREIIREIAAEGNDCVIVGRDADVILHDANPFRISVCADIGSRLARCVRHEEKKEPSERLTEKEILRNIRRIDRNRRRTREVLTGKSAADGSAFDLTVNATDWDIKKLAEAVAEFSARWFER
ncbi:MAG: cytidylate kinase-like family protein [Clostridia bacterium]|nr:cytidylate kinase-like family protein [Clostridia bacterium]